MAHELYFLPILLDALDATQCREALREAFSKIIVLGREPGYELGYTRFKEFMKIVGEGTSLDEQSDSDHAVVQFLISFCKQMSPRGVLSTDLQTDPILYKRCQRLVSELQQLMPDQITLEIVVESGEEVLARLDACQEGTLGRVRHIRPGTYRLSLSTGRRLWEGILTRSDLLCEGRPLALAADENGLAGEPAREIAMLSGEIVVKVYRGLESGVLEIVRMPTG
jgi:hypothetical protein